MIATVAFAGIEAAANLAPDIDAGPGRPAPARHGRRDVVPLLYFGVAVVALMAVPVVPTPDGATTALGTTFMENPVLGVVQSFDRRGSPT